MAKFTELDQEAWLGWVAERPPVIQDLCRRFPPDTLYRLKTSNHRVTIHSYSEDGTMTVSVRGEFNLVSFERNVFGVKPEDLEECDLPSPDDSTGAVLSTQQEIDEFIERIR